MQFFPLTLRGTLLAIFGAYIAFAAAPIANAATYTCSRKTYDYYGSCTPSGFLNNVMSYIERGCWSCRSDFRVQQTGTSDVEVEAATWQAAEVECRKNPPKYEVKNYKVSQACSYDSGLSRTRVDGDCRYQESRYSCDCTEKVAAANAPAIDDESIENDASLSPEAPAGSTAAGFSGTQPSDDSDFPGFGSTSVCITPSSSPSQPANLYAVPSTPAPVPNTAPRIAPSPQAR